MRQCIKKIVPKPLLKPLRNAETYVKRPGIWLSVRRHVRGISPQDRSVLRRSFLAAPWTAASKLDEWRDPVLLEDAEVEVRNVGRFRLRKRSDDLYHVLPTREDAIFRAIGSALTEGCCFVDAGANIGFYTVFAAKKVGAGGRVTAIEMMPDTAAILREHVHLNRLDNVEIVEKALSDRDGSSVTAHVPQGKFGQASIAGPARGRAVQVETATLDTILKDIPSIRLMKMDLEGAEETALRGAPHCLARTDAVIFESWADEAAVGDILAEHGFAIRRLDGRNCIAFRE